MKDLLRSETRSRRLRDFTLAAFICGLTLTPALSQVIPADVQWLEPSDEENWVVISAGGAFTDGDKASYEARHQINSDGFGGIEELRQVFTTGGGVLNLDARLLAGNNDFKVKLDFEAEGGWRLRGGFRQYRVWYDASGGYIPVDDTFIQPFDDSMYVDRGRFWVEYEMAPDEGLGGFLRYSHDYRDGQKDTTHWSYTNAPETVGRKAISPNFYDLDETRDTIEGEVNYTKDTTKVGLGLVYQMSDFENRRQIRREPGESTDRYQTTKDENSTDLFTTHAYVDTQFNEQWRFSAGGIYTNLDATFSGDRIWGSSYDPIFDPNFQRQNRDEGYLDLHVDSGMEQYVGNLNLLFRPDKNWRVLGAVRMEKVDTDAMSDFIETNYYNGAATADELAGMSDKQFDEIGEKVEVQFRGLKTAIITGSAEWTQGDGDLRESLIEVEDGAVDIERDTGWDRNTEKYALSALWHPNTTIGLTGQVYHKVRSNDFQTTQDSTPPIGGDRFPAFITYQRLTTDDINVRLSWRPDPKFSMVARIDDQKTKIDSQEEGLGRVQSGNLKTRIYSGSATFLPQGWLMLQGTVNYVSDDVKTGLSGSALDIVNNATHDYWVGTLSAILAVDEDTDIQLDYTAYDADNFVDNSEFSVPYGVTENEKVLRGSITHRFSDQMMVTGQYSYAKYDSSSTGGYNDYTAHTLYGRVAYRF